VCGGIACRSLLSRGQGQSLQLKDGFLYCLLKYTDIHFGEATKIYILQAEDCMKELEKGKRQLGESMHGELKTGILLRR
jgi:hypothetical protein